MATWRRRALELFPELRNEIHRRKYSPYQLFADLRRIVWRAHDAGDDVTLRWVYGFAAWCNNQRSERLYNPAGVSFYEHLFDERKDRADWAKVVRWLSPQVVCYVWSLWDGRLSPEELRDLRAPLAESGKLPNR